MTDEKPVLLKWDDPERDRYRDELYALDSRQRLYFLQNILRDTNAIFEEVIEVNDPEEMQKFIDAGIYDDFDELQEDLLEFGNYESYIRLLLHKNKLLSFDSEVFAERFTVGEVISIYPSIWQRAFDVCKIDMSGITFQTTINGKKANPDDSFEIDDTIETSFIYKGVNYQFKYVRDEVFSDMLDISIVDHIESFMNENNIGQHLLKVSGDGLAEYYFLPKESVEAIDRYK